MVSIYKIKNGGYCKSCGEIFVCKGKTHQKTKIGVICNKCNKRIKGGGKIRVGPVLREHNKKNVMFELAEYINENGTVPKTKTKFGFRSWRHFKLTPYDLSTSEIFYKFKDKQKIPITGKEGNHGGKNE